MRFETNNKANVLATLAGFPMFAECGRRDLDLIDRAGTQVDIAAGHVLCRQGDVGEECFIVLSGHAHVTIDDRLVRTVSRGALVGEIALLSPPGRRIATVTAQSTMSLFVFGPREFGDLIRTTPGLSKRLVYEICERLTEDLARVRIDGGWSSRTFAVGRHWGDDRWPISRPTATSSEHRATAH